MERNESDIDNNSEYINQLSKWSWDNKALVTLLQKDKQIGSMRDIAMKFNKSSFIEMVKDIVPVESQENKKSYALNLYHELFHLEPTAVLINMIKDPQIPILNNVIGANVVTFLENQPDFNIKTTSIYEIFKKGDALKCIATVEAQEDAKTQLETLQRIVAISPVADAIPVLYNANMDTAFQIAEMPKQKFMSLMKDEGLDEPTLSQIHINAQKTRVRNEQTLITIRENSDGKADTMIDNNP